MRARKRSKASRRATSAICSSGSRTQTAPAMTTPAATIPKIWTTTMTNPVRNHPDELIVGLVSISDRASTGVYEDKGIPSLQEWLGSALTSPFRTETRLIQDDAPTITKTLIELVDEAGCDLVLTTGGTGPARRDVTPEATLAAGTKEMPGFGEQMRQIS